MESTALKIVPSLKSEPAFKIVGYARISFDEDKESYESIINQKNIIRDYALKNFGVEDVYIYEDDNFSGYKFDRPAFNQMKLDVFDGVYDIIIAKDLSRIGRHNAQTLMFFEEMENLDKRIIAINDDIDTINKNNDLTMGVKTWYNELYVKDISKKIRSTIANKQKNANWICTVPFGYRMDLIKKHEFSVDESCATIVKRIFDLYINGWGYKKIANLIQFYYKHNL